MKTISREEGLKRRKGRGVIKEMRLDGRFPSGGRRKRTTPGSHARIPRRCVGKVGGGRRKNPEEAFKTLGYSTPGRKKTTDGSRDDARRCS